jgi:hypothetical protein
VSSPWLQIPIVDYEGHMSLASVAQSQMLAGVLQRAVAEFRPRSLAVLGAAGGNGLDCVDPGIVQRVVAVDFNPEYLTLCTKRYAGRFTQYEAVLHDLRDGPPSFEPVDLVYAGLVLEYLDCLAFVNYLPRLLSPGGVFVAVLQLPSASLPEVSPSPFVSLTRLEGAFQFVDPAALRAALVGRGFSCCEENVIRLASGKEFHYGFFRWAGNSPTCCVGERH